MTPIKLKFETSLSNWENIESEEVRPNIFIPTAKVNSSFNREVKLLIDRIETNPIGRRLFEKISRCLSQIYIHSDSRDHTTWEYLKDKAIQPVLIGFSMQDRFCFSTKAEPIPFPKHVVLVHELIHAYHFLSGKSARSQCCDPLVWGPCDEEYKTIVGFPSKKAWKKTAKITENAFRQAEGLPERFGFYFPPSPMAQDIIIARTRMLGAIHERNQAARPDDLSPPPVALCSIADLGFRTYTVSRITLYGVENLFSTLCYGAPTEEWFGNGCYLRVSGFETPEQIENGRTIQQQEKDQLLSKLFTTNKRLHTTKPAAEKLVKNFWPQYDLKGFMIESISYIRCSQEEVDILEGQSRQAWCRQVEASILDISNRRQKEKSNPVPEISGTLKTRKSSRFLGSVSILGILVMLGILGLRRVFVHRLPRSL